MLLFTTRKIGKFLRGDVTPLQVMFACVIGSVAGLTPSIMQAPGLFLLLFLMVMILNANLFLTAAVGVMMKLIGVLATPVLYFVGRAALDGPTQPIFKAMINAPVLALFGFEYYAVTGAVVVGVVVGVGLALLIGNGLTRFRKKMASLEEDSDAYKTWTGKWYIKSVLWLVAGGVKGKKSFDQLLARRRGNPIRIVGVIFAVLTLALVVIVLQFAKEPIITAVLKSGLERANGATVDVGSAELDLGANRLIIHNLAMADPKALETDLLRAETVEADLAGLKLLTKRFEIDTVVVRDAVHGAKRRIKGRIIGKTPEPTPPDDDADGRSIEDYLKSAKEWKERLQQIRDWIEKTSGEQEPPSDEEEQETFKEQLERQIREKGYARVEATHLIVGAPTMMVRNLRVEKLRIEKDLLNDETLDVHGYNLSTQPWLDDQAPRIDVTSSKDSLGVHLTLGDALAVKQSNLIDMHLTGLSADAIARELKFGVESPLAGGSIDVSLDGQWSVRSLNIPLRVTLYNTKLQLPGFGDESLAKLPLELGLRGPLDNPKVIFDAKMLSRALAAAGKKQAAQAIAGGLENLLGDDIGKQVGGVLEGITGGGGSGDSSDVGSDVRKPGEEAGRAIERGIGDLLGGGSRKKDDAKERAKEKASE